MPSLYLHHRVFWLFPAYSFLLQSLYPFTSLPIPEYIRDTLKSQTSYVSEGCARFSIQYLAVLIPVAVFHKIFDRYASSIRMYLSSKTGIQFGSGTVGNTNESGGRVDKGSGWEEAQRPISPYPTAISLLASVAGSIACVLNDAIYNRPENTDIFEGAYTRVFESAGSVLFRPNFLVVLISYCILLSLWIISQPVM